MKPAEGEVDTREYPCLLRATDGGKTKFSTQVSVEPEFATLQDYIYTFTS